MPSSEQPLSSTRKMHKCQMSTFQIARNFPHKCKTSLPQAISLSASYSYWWKRFSMAHTLNDSLYWILTQDRLRWKAVQESIWKFICNRTFSSITFPFMLVFLHTRCPSQFISNIKDENCFRILSKIFNCQLEMSFESCVNQLQNTLMVQRDVNENWFARHIKERQILCLHSMYNFKLEFQIPNHCTWVFCSVFHCPLK